jgi:hypothetical protein
MLFMGGSFDKKIIFEGTELEGKNKTLVIEKDNSETTSDKNKQKNALQIIDKDTKNQFLVLNLK